MIGSKLKFGALPIVAMGMLAYGAARVFDMAGSDGAFLPSDAPVFSAAFIAETENEPALPSQPHVVAIADEGSEVERRILEKLGEQRALLDERERELDAREAVLSAAEVQLTEQIRIFEDKRAALIEAQQTIDEAKAEELNALVGAYERMKAKDAAAIFNDLDEEILLSVARQMRMQALSGVLAEMTPENARRLTKRLAETPASGAAELSKVEP